MSKIACPARKSELHGPISTQLETDGSYSILIMEKQH